MQQIRRRIAILQRMLGDRPGCSILVTDPANVYYLTGFLTQPFERFMGVVVAATGEPVLIVPALERENAAAQSCVEQVLSYRDEEDPYDLLAEVLRDLRVQALAVEKKHLTVGNFERIGSSLAGLTTLDASPWLEQVRARKDEGEIELMRKAAELTCRALSAGISAIEQGASEAEAAALIDYQLRCLGADGPAFPTTVLVGANSALPHGVAGPRRAQPGDPVLFDFGARYRGYCADITRTFVFREARGEFRRMYEVVLAAQLAGIEAARAGRLTADVDRASRRVIEEAGYGEYFVHRTGHGLGLQAHEYPSVGPGGREYLEPGMVITVEPGIYIPGVGGVRIEDDVLVTDEDPVVLTEYPRELRVIG